MATGTWYRLRSCLVAATVCFLTFNNLQAQIDTIKLTPAQAGQTFLRKNLSLLAAQYNIDANRELIKQAKLWDNPVISTDQNIYDQQGGFLKHDANNGQVYVQVMQLIKTAGKRNKLARLAEDNTHISQAQFDDLLRTLHYTLISDFYEIDHQLKMKRVYDSEIHELETLSKGMDVQMQSGNVSMKDNMRVKALLFNLNNELVNIDSQLLPIESEVRLLLRITDSSFIAPSFSYYLPDVIKIKIPAKDSLMQFALENRPDASIAKRQLEFQQHNLLYQQALAKPDLSIGTEYDQRSSYAPNYVGLAISFPLNIFNRNQGNINSAKASVKQQEVLLDAQTQKIQNDISSSIEKIRFYQKVNDLQQLDFSRQYDMVFQNMLKSYEQRQVSLLEFIDFADAYKDTKLKLLEQHTGLIRAVVELNYLLGKDVFIINK